MNNNLQTDADEKRKYKFRAAAFLLGVAGNLNPFVRQILFI